MMKSIKRTEELYSHEYLWRSSTSLLESTEEDNYHILMPSLLMNYLAFEAFINFCGYVVLPEVWKNEKTSFRGKSIEDKIALIVAEIPNFNWEKGKPPYQTIKKIASYRDWVVHGKVCTKLYDSEIETDFIFKFDFDEFHTKSFVEDARHNVQKFSESLLIELRKISDHPHLIHKAYEGSLASGYC